MEVKAPRNIMKFKESVMFGLNFRQFFCSSIAVIIAVITYFGLRDYLGNEGVSWVCILVALPIALIGFVTYHEISLEHFILTWIKSELLMPKKLYFKSDNCMYILYKRHVRDKKQEQLKQKQVNYIKRFKRRVLNIVINIRKATYIKLILDNILIIKEKIKHEDYKSMLKKLTKLKQNTKVFGGNK